jgi:hypothetical protein
MSRRKQAPAGSTPHVPPVLDWEVSETYQHNGRHIDRGTELKIAGESGRFLFLKHVRRPSGIEWIDTIHFDSKGASTGYHSFRPERIKTVHRLSKTRANAA